MADITRDSYSIIYDELQKVDGPKGSTNDSVQIVCPFHSDTDPSLGVYMGIGMQIPLGFFNCFGCGEKGHWNKLAEKLHLQKISSVNDKIKTTREVDSKLAKIKANLEVVNSTTQLSKLITSIGNPAHFPWSDDEPWRSFSGKLINQVGGMYLSEPHRRNSELVCFFPIKINKRYYGGFKAYLDKKDGRPSYINTQGDWTKSYGLFPYVYCYELIRRYKLEYVVLVEGPRDALRLLAEGIPAISTLGARQFTREKLRLILKLGAKHLFTMPDSDNGGKEFKLMVKEQIKEYNQKSPIHIKYNNFTIPPLKGKKGKASKQDPGSMSYDLVEEFMDVIDGMGYGLAPEFS